MSSKVPDQVNKHSPKSETHKHQTEKIPESVKSETHKDLIEKPPKSETQKGQSEKAPKTDAQKGQIKKSPISAQNGKVQPKTVHTAAKKSLAKSEHDNHHKAAGTLKDQTPPSRLKFSTFSASSEKMLNASGETLGSEPPRYSQFIAKRDQMLKLLSPKFAQMSAKKEEIMDLLSAKTNFAEVHSVLAEAAAIVNASFVQDTDKRSLQSLTNTPNSKNGQSNQ